MGDAPGAIPTLAHRLAQKLSLRARVAIVALALGLWTLSVFEHEVGGQLFGKLFNWGKATWGPDGGRIVERGIFAIGLLMAGVVIVGTAIRVVRAPGGPAAVPELAARWVAWFLFAYAANRFTICLQSEDVHFAQYGFVAFCFALATGRPRLAFLVATFLGFVDESNQWWRMYFDTYDNHLDWNDMILNACGACAGALPFTSLLRIARYAEGSEDRIESGGSWTLCGAIAASITALILFLIYKTDMGHYPAWPFWTELDNKKPFHVLTLREGLPALLGISYVLYYVVDERRRGLPMRALVGVMLAIHIAVVPPRSDHEQRVHEHVPTTKIPRAPKAPTIDGKLEKDEWAHAAVVELHSFAPDATDKQREEFKLRFGPELATKAYVQWDEKALYVAFECASEDVWARKLSRDDPTIAGDSLVELFLDTDGSEMNYYEFDISSGNAVQDLFVYWPQPPAWRPDPMRCDFVGLNRWDAKGLETAVSAQGGACDLLEPQDPAGAARTLPKTAGYTVEMAIPWTDLRGRHVPPHAGSRMRANLCRIEVPRPRNSAASTCLTWSPTRVPLDFHRPQFFGVWVFEE
jgi:hypothetical protein